VQCRQGRRRRRSRGGAAEHPVASARPSGSVGVWSGVLQCLGYARPAAYDALERI
jgi:hypothetical protein